MKSKKIGIYVDAINQTLNGGYGLRYDILRKYCTFPDHEPARMNVYVSYDEHHAKEDENYEAKTARFCNVLRDFEFKVIERRVKRIVNHETGEAICRSSVELEMAADIIKQSKNLDQIYLLTNDEGFIPIIRLAQDNGCKVELIAFDNVPETLKHEVDTFMSGFLIPGLLPIESGGDWGKVGSRVRGVCYDFTHGEGYGFMRYMNTINDNTWITDSRNPNSPYKTIFCHISQFEHHFDSSFLPSRDLIFEFSLMENDKGLISQKIELVSAP
ncbi:NYN domain-containing protein [bacterium]|nr:MAG: NYN domain-containing protein [bacterium]